MEGSSGVLCALDGSRESDEFKISAGQRVLNIEATTSPIIIAVRRIIFSYCSPSRGVATKLMER